MKRLFPTLTLSVAAAFAPCVGLAQSANHTESPRPESELPNFDFGELHVEQKFNMSVGFRSVSGPKVTFSGGEGFIIGDISQAIDPSITDQAREYHDGFVGLGNPADAKTNTWGMTDAKQLVNGGQDVAMHLYSAEITDGGTHRTKQGSDFGAELLVEREMGRIGKRLEWKLFAGFSVNNVSGAARDGVTASITTLRDLYSLAGQTLPNDPPYNAPSFITDPNDADKVIDTTVFLGRGPDSRTIGIDVGDSQVFKAWKLKGSYVTFRVGPTLIYDISEKIKLSISAGPVLMYSGTTYTVETLFLLDNGASITERMEDSDSKVLTGYYGDVTLHYMITDRAGFYAGAFFQSGDSYDHDMEDIASSYSAHIDLESLNGFRAGLQYKF